MLTSEDVKGRARELGFDLCGVASPEPRPELRLLARWLGRGFHAEMGYLARNVEKRLDPRLVLPSVRSIVVLGTVYNTGTAPSTVSTAPHAALLSRYAWGDDYHDVLDSRLRVLETWMRERSDASFEARRYVDTGPVVERVAAFGAGLGWIGKNTCLINAELGSWVFLCEILCSLPLRPDEPDIDRCGTCTLCIEACPTQALVEDRTLDATRCISYLTIELKHDIPDDLREAVGRHAYGCDICQEVCPWNAESIAPVSADRAWRPRPEFAEPDLLDLWRMPDAALRRAIKGTAMTRARVTRLRRNLAVAIGNCGDADAARVFDEPLDAPSLDDPLVQEHVRWARAKLATTPAGSSRTSRPSPR